MPEETKVNPLGDRVLVKPDEPEVVSKGGIIIPESAKKKSERGVVVAAGPGRVNDDNKLIPNRLEVGDKVLYGKYSGTEVEIDNEQYFIMGSGDVFAKL